MHGAISEVKKGGLQADQQQPSKQDPGDDCEVVRVVAPPQKPPPNVCNILSHEDVALVVEEMSAHYKRRSASALAAIREPKPQPTAGRADDAGEQPKPKLRRLGMLETQTILEVCDQDAGAMNNSSSP